MRYFIGGERLIESNLYKIASINECIKWLEEQKMLGLDTETEGFFNHFNKIIMLQLSNGIDTYVIDVRNSNYLELLHGKIENKLILGQNLKFDYKFLKFHGIVLTNIYDTFLAECILTNGLLDRKLGLGAISEKYTGKQLDKSVRNQFINLQGSPFTDKQIVYGAEDVEGLFEIREKQLIEIEKYDLINALELEFKACLALGDIEYNGFRLNTAKWLEIAKKAEEKIPLYEQELDDMVKDDKRLNKFIAKYVQGDLFGETVRDIDIKWSSPTQVSKVIKALGIDLPSTSEKEISKYQNEYPIIKKFIDYKKDCKLTTTYGKDFLKWVNSRTGKIHTEFWQIKDTARVGSSNPNMQNLPAKNEYLNCFVAKEGWKIVGIDYAAQEARLAACGSKDELWLNTFNSGLDLHSEVCKLMFGITDDLVRTKPDFLRGKTYRDAAKTINFGVLFGMSKFKLSKSLSITIEEAESLIEQYFKATKQLKSYLDRCAQYGLKNGYIRSFKPYSGIRWFPQWKPNLDKRKDFKIIGEITRASYNTPIQMSGGLMTKLALVKIREYILDNNLSSKVKLIHVVHDATYCEVVETFAKEWSEIQSNLMIEAGKEFNLSLSMDTDITIESYWTK